MHQHPRPSPITASPASSPRTNPTRTNNPREEGASSHTRNISDMPSYDEGDEGSGESGVIPSTGPSKDAVKKLDQILQVGHEHPKYLHRADVTCQNFHTKAAIVILQSRMSLPIVLGKDGYKKVNKWVNYLIATLGPETN